MNNSQPPPISQEMKGLLLQNYLTIQEASQEEELFEEIVSDVFRMEAAGHSQKATPIKNVNKVLNQFLLRRSSSNDVQPSNVYSAQKSYQEETQTNAQKTQTWCPYLFGIFIIGVAIFFHWLAINTKKNQPVNPFYS